MNDKHAPILYSRVSDYLMLDPRVTSVRPYSDLAYGILITPSPYITIGDMEELCQELIDLGALNTAPVYVSGRLFITANISRVVVA